MLEACNICMINWYANAVYAVYEDGKSHLELIFTTDKGSIASSYTKKTSNMHSSTESKLNDTDKCILKI